VKIYTIAPVANPDELEGYGGLYCETCASETDARNMASERGVMYREMSATYNGWHAETCDMCGIELSEAITVPASRDHKGARFDFVEEPATN
jgi:hypothetical protein